MWSPREVNKMKNKQLIITIVLILVFSAASFYGGLKYQQNKKPAFTRQFGNAGRAGQNQLRAGARNINGEIISADSKSITVKLTDGSSKIVVLSDSVTINKAETATKDDLKVGEKVMVFGQDNSDGSVTAQNIQLNPIIRTLPTQIPNQ